ncbi:LacI family DNA-binding transcriptional regulator [Streptomyces sp. MS2A]|nr:LacI family DNA-binding transcriptional regulator [Streptomyces sp. MS2A]
MTVTIREVAAEAGLSISTVSRAFSNPEVVNLSTRERVRVIAERLGYQPNQAARLLRGGRSGSIGLIIPDITNPFFAPILKAIQVRARRHGQTVLVADGDEHPDAELDAIEVLRPRVDGLVLWSPTVDADTLAQIHAKTPVVLINRELEGFPQVHIDLAPGVAQAGESLVAYGHRRCAFVNAHETDSPRAASIRGALSDAGLDVVEFGPYEARFETGVHAAPLVLSAGATAVVAHNDLVALGLLQQFAALGVSVPRDVSVVGIDDTILAATATPGLATVRIDPEAVAAAATDALLAELSGDPGSGRATSAPHVVSTRFIPRASSGPAA